MSSTFKVVIPARYASQRLPGKPLEDIGGLPMVVRVGRQAEASGAEEVIIATDDERVLRVAVEYEVRAEMTAREHQSGTDRVAELAERFGWADDCIVVNVQGDEPLVPPALIAQVAGLLQHNEEAAVATLATPLRSDAEFTDPNNVRVVTDRSGRALYFSRAAIPFPREGGVPENARRHVGLYAYRVGKLKKIARMAVCELETTEKLEQLRVLWSGESIIVADACELPPPGVDTPEDLARVRAVVSEYA